MQTKIIKLDTTAPDDSILKEAAEIIDGGGLVAFPTETVYGIACRVEHESLARLSNLKGRTPDKFYTLHIGQRSDLYKYLPTIGLREKKLIKTSWPGPLSLVFELSERDIERQKKKLEPEVFECLYKYNSIGIRYPDNAIAQILLQSAKYPIVAPSANITGQSPPVNGQQVISVFDGQLDMILDAGPTRCQKSSTVAKMQRTGLVILRPGVYPETELKAKSTVTFLFVCSGNTCRSPMAEGMFRKYLAEKLEVSVDLLEKIGYKTISAGTLGLSGMPATPEAMKACAAKGIDLSSHCSTGLTRQLVNESDLIFAMSKSHLQLISSISSEAAEKCMLLAGNEDIADPIGKPLEVYRECAERIEAAVKKRISELVL